MGHAGDGGAHTQALLPLPIAPCHEHSITRGDRKHIGTSRGGAFALPNGRLIVKATDSITEGDVCHRTTARPRLLQLKREYAMLHA